MIVKVQMPLASNVQEPLALVYNKDRSYMAHMQITDDLIKEMNGSNKKYFEAFYDEENNDTVLQKEVPAQNW